MRIFVFVLACLAFVGLSRRVATQSNYGQRSKTKTLARILEMKMKLDVLKGLQGALQVLPARALALTAAAAFDLYGPVLHLPVVHERFHQLPRPTLNSRARISTGVLMERLDAEAEETVREARVKAAMGKEFGSEFAAQFHAQSKAQKWARRAQPPALSAAEERPKNMVDTKTFVAAVKALETSAGTAEAASDKEATYAIGRILVSLSLDPEPGLDLAEAPGLVLVSGVKGNAEEVGIQPGDTIVSVGANNGSYLAETKGLNLEETGTILMTAANHAIENGSTEVQLEINRLIQIAYQ